MEYIYIPFWMNALRVFAMHSWMALDFDPEQISKVQETLLVMIPFICILCPDTVYMAIGKNSCYVYMKSRVVYIRTAS